MWISLMVVVDMPCSNLTSVPILLIFCCRMLPGPVTCLCVNDDQLMFGGSLLGNIGVSGVRSDQRVVMLRSRNTVGHIWCLNFRFSMHVAVLLLDDSPLFEFFLSQTHYMQSTTWKKVLWIKNEAFQTVISVLFWVVSFFCFLLLKIKIISSQIFYHGFHLS